MMKQVLKQCMKMLHSAEHMTKEARSECLKPVQKCHAMLSSELTLECGCMLPVISDACQSHKERMPVCIGMIGNQSVSVLRDTGCSTAAL